MTVGRVKCPACSHINDVGAASCASCNTPLPRVNISAPSYTPTRQHQASPMDAIQFRQGQVVANRYLVKNLIGRGGMGCIYKVDDNILGEAVALKTLLPQYVRDKLVVERFFNEARIARRLAHPNIVRVHDIGSANGVVYISMEFLEGRSLRSLLDKQPPGSRLPLEQVLRLFDELVAALEYAHRFTVHRDIKPENVMVMEDGSIKLMDFGISKLMTNTRLTGASMVMGTPFYMSPEQLRNSRDVDARADIYSIGVMLYEVLTGQMPAGVAKPITQVRSELPPVLDTIVSKCVEQDPANRYQSASELRAALRSVRELIGINLEKALSGPPVAKETPRPRVNARRALGVLLAILVFAGTVGAEYALEQRWRGTPAGIAGDLSDPEYRYSVIKALAAQAIPLAERRARSSQSVQQIYDQGLALWNSTEATGANDVTQANEVGARALQYLLAPLVWEQGMVFVPPGKAFVGSLEFLVPAFLMDEAEVTVTDFGDFCRDVPGGWVFPREQAEYLDQYGSLPVAWVAYYDAEGYAAWKGKLVPTEEQWVRAAYGAGEGEGLPQYPWGETWEPGKTNQQDSGLGSPTPVKSYESDQTWTRCRDMAGNVSEWTRTVAEADAPEGPAWGKNLVVRGGNFMSSETKLSSSEKAPYETRTATIGFRCVKEIPSDLRGIKMLLDEFQPVS